MHALWIGRICHHFLGLTIQLGEISAFGQNFHVQTVLFDSVHVYILTYELMFYLVVPWCGILKKYPLTSQNPATCGTIVHGALPTFVFPNNYRIF